MGWARSGGVEQRQFPRVSPWPLAGRAGLQTKVREDLLDGRLLQDRSDVLQFAAAVRAVRSAWTQRPIPDGLKLRRCPLACRGVLLDQKVQRGLLGR
jgi:hypothetical protein